jgi:hypothetical protein
MSNFPRDSDDENHRRAMKLAFDKGREYERERAKQELYDALRTIDQQRHRLEELEREIKILRNIIAAENDVYEK